jgi:hypothetical protein
MSDVGRPAPEVYRQSIERLPLAVGRARRLVALEVVAGATVLCVLAFLVTDDAAGGVDAALVVGILALLSLPYFLWRAGRRVRRYWNAFELSIGPETVRVAAKGEGRITIRRDEIASAVEGANELRICSREPGVVVRVPITVEGYVDARARLSAWHPITARPDDLYWCAGLAAAGGLVAAGAVLAPRATVLLAALFVCEAAFAAFAVGEIVANPRLEGAAKIRVVVFAVVSVVAPVILALR